MIALDNGGDRSTQSAIALQHYPRLIGNIRTLN